MSTKIPPCLDSAQVDQATSVLRVINHKFRFAIVDCLIENDNMTSQQLVEKIGVNEVYMDEQLDILHENEFVEFDCESGQTTYRVNEQLLSKISAAIRKFATR